MIIGMKSHMKEVGALENSFHDNQQLSLVSCTGIFMVESMEINNSFIFLFCPCCNVDIIGKEAREERGGVCS